MLARNTDTADLGGRACGYGAKGGRPEVGARFAPKSVSSNHGTIIWSLCYCKNLLMGTPILHDLTEFWKNYMKLDHVQFPN
jgi:hypothetical protein